MFRWWFSPRGSYAKVKIPVGAALLFMFVTTVIAAIPAMSLMLSRAFPIFLRELSISPFVLLSCLPPQPILWGGLFFLSYHTFGVKKQGWKAMIKSGAMLIAAVLLLILLPIFSFFL